MAVSKINKLPLLYKINSVKVLSNGQAGVQTQTGAIIQENGYTPVGVVRLQPIGTAFVPNIIGITTGNEYVSITTNSSSAIPTTNGVYAYVLYIRN